MIHRIFAAASIVVLLAASPAPAPMPFPQPKLPNRPLHVQLQVEVNRRGQVVRVAHGDLSGDRAFDIMMLGNAMQMWIRTPDGHAITGLYRVQYDYDPKKQKVSRVPSMISAGGNWADKPGAATLIMAEARRETLQAYERLRQEKQKQDAQRAKSLPDINAAVKRAMSHASASPSPKP